jgi:hypothetical protein
MALRNTILIEIGRNAHTSLLSSSLGPSSHGLFSQPSLKRYGECGRGTLKVHRNTYPVPYNQPRLPCTETLGTSMHLCASLYLYIILGLIFYGRSARPVNPALPPVGFEGDIFATIEAHM